MHSPRTFRALLLGSALPLVLLTGCASTGDGGLGGLGRGAAQTLLERQCHTTLAEQRAWQMARLALPAAQAAELEREVCACAGEEAAARLTPAQLVQLSTDQGRAQVIADVLVPTVTACYQKLAGNLY